MSGSYRNPGQFMDGESPLKADSCSTHQLCEMYCWLITERQFQILKLTLPHVVIAAYGSHIFAVSIPDLAAHLFHFQ
jgi:hypothetical protein